LRAVPAKAPQAAAPTPPAAPPILPPEFAPVDAPAAPAAAAPYWFGRPANVPFEGFQPSRQVGSTNAFGDVENTRYGVFLSDNKDISRQFGTQVDPYTLDIRNTADLDTPAIRDQFSAGIDQSVDPDLFALARLTKEPWQFFDGRLGERFTQFLRSQGYDSARFLERMSDPANDNLPISGRTTVALDPAAVRPFQTAASAVPDPLTRIQQKLAMGEQIGSPDLRANFELQQQANAARRAADPAQMESLWYQAKDEVAKEAAARGSVLDPAVHEARFKQLVNEQVPALRSTEPLPGAPRAPENPLHAILMRQPEESLQAGATKLAQLDDTQIHQVIEESGYGSPQERAALADTLISRRDDVVGKMSAESGQPAPLDLLRNETGAVRLGGDSDLPAIKAQRLTNAQRSVVEARAAGDTQLLAAAEEELRAAQQLNPAYTGQRYTIKFRNGQEYRFDDADEALGFARREARARNELGAVLYDKFENRPLNYTGFNRRFSDETGAIRPDLAARMGGAAVGGLVGGTYREEDGDFSLGKAAFGAALGAIGGKMLSSEMARRAAAKVQQAYTHHGGAEAALKQVNPPHLRTRLSDSLKDLVKASTETFSSFDELKRAETTHGAGFYSPAIDELSQHFTRKFQWPLEMLQKVTHSLAPLKNFKEYKHTFDILRLRRDLEEVVLDITRRQDGFATIKQLSAAKSTLLAALKDPNTSGADRADLAARYTAVKAQMNKARARLPKKRGPNDPIRGTMTFQDAELTLREAMAAAPPNVIEAVNRVKVMLRQVGDELVNVGALDASTLTQNSEYFPDFVLKHLGQNPVGIRAGKGVSYTRLGALRQRKGRTPDTEIWNDLAGPLMKRMLDQRAMLENVTVVQRIVNQYDAQANGLMGPTDPIPQGYTKYTFHDTGKVKAPVVEAVIPLELASELKARFTPLNTLERVGAGIRKNMSGWLLRWSGLPFIARNVSSDTAHAYASTKASEWLSLPMDQMKGAIAAELFQRYRDPAAVPATPSWMRAVGVDMGQLWSMADRAERAGAGTAAASAEITEATIRDPHLRSIARNPERGMVRTAASTVGDAVHDGTKMFDDARAVGEGTNRIALFMRMIRNGAQDAQAGKVVNLQQGRYDEGWYSPVEQKVRRVGLVPFYAWQKIAANQWIPYLAKEVASEGTIHKGRKAAGAAVLRKYGRIAPWALVAPMVWNHVFFPEAESLLSDRQKANPHVFVPDPTDPWDDENERWNLKLITLPGGVNNVARLVGLGGAPNRAVHAALGTGSTSPEEEWEYTWKQAMEHYLSLAGTVISVPGMLMTGRDWVTNTSLDRPGAGPGERIANRLGYVATSMPPMRHVEASARESQGEGQATADQVLKRLVTGGVYADFDQDIATARAVRRSIAKGYKSGERTKGERDQARRAGEPLKIGKEEALGMSGAAEATWQALAIDLMELNKKTSAEASPDAPGAAERAQGPLFGVTLGKGGPKVVPTTALLSQWGPDKTLKTFLAADSAPGMESFKAEMRSIADQLSQNDQRWEIPLAIMQMMEGGRPMDVDVDIMKRLQGLAGAKKRQKSAPFQ
jgi:hypothetical protein